MGTSRTRCGIQSSITSLSPFQPEKLKKGEMRLCLKNVFLAQVIRTEYVGLSTSTWVKTIAVAEMQDTETYPSSWVNLAFIRLSKEHAAVAYNKSQPQPFPKHCITWRRIDFGNYIKLWLKLHRIHVNIHKLVSRRWEEDLVTFRTTGGSCTRSAFTLWQRNWKRGGMRERSRKSRRFFWTDPGNSGV